MLHAHPGRGYDKAGDRGHRLKPTAGSFERLRATKAPSVAPTMLLGDATEKVEPGGDRP
jgi:hypothetical protein